MKRGLVLGTVLLVSGASILAGGPYAQRLGTTAALYAALALSWNLVGGLAGYPSFATAAFFGLGAYASVVLQVSGWPGWLGWLAGVTIPTVFAATLGPVLMRLRGHYFAVATLVIAPVLRELINAAEFTGGGMGLSIPVPAGSDPALQGRLSFLGMFGVAATLVGITRLVRRGRLGWLLLLDEVNAGLNPAEIDVGLRLIERIASDGITILLIEHLMKVVLGACSRIIVLHHGVLIADGAPVAVMRDPAVAEAYLGPRYAAQAS